MDQVSDPRAGATVADLRDLNFMLQVYVNNLRFVVDWSQAYDPALGLTLRVRLADAVGQPAEKQCAVRFILATTANAGTSFTTPSVMTKEGLLVDAARLDDGWYGIQSTGPTLAAERIPFVFLVETVDAFGLGGVARRFPFYSTTLPPYDASFQRFTPFDNATVNGGGTTPAPGTTAGQGGATTSGVWGNATGAMGTTTAGARETTAGFWGNATGEGDTSTSVWANATGVEDTATSVWANASGGDETATSVWANTTGGDETTTSVWANATGGDETTTSVWASATGVDHTATSVWASATGPWDTSGATDGTARSSGASSSSVSQRPEGDVTSARSDARTPQVTSTAAGGDAGGEGGTTPTPLPPPPPALLPPAFPVAAVVGAGVGVAGAGLVCSALAFFGLRRRSRKEPEEEGPEELPRLRIRIDQAYLWHSARGGGERGLKK
jgi:hypothetical protein